MKQTDLNFWHIPLGMLVAVVVLGLSLWFTLAQRAAMRRANVEVKRKTAEIYSAIESSISGVRTAKAFANEAREIEKCRQELFGIIASHSGQPVEKVFSDGDRNVWMTAREALDYGMVDRIMTRQG